MGLAASCMVGIGEFLIHFNPDPSNGNLPYGYFLDIGQYQMELAHFIMVPFIPLYLFGYGHFYLALRPGSKRLAQAVLVLGIWAIVISAIWVGSRAHLGITVQALQDVENPEIRTTILESYDLLMENLLGILRMLIIVISLCFTACILKGNTLYPKWMAFFNPVVLLVIVLALYFYVRPIGQYLAPTAMNVAHVIIFSASLFALRSRNVRT